MQWIMNHKELVTSLIAISALLWQPIQFFMTHNSDARNRHFEAYHGLVKEIVQPTDSPQGVVFRDRQCAAIFELRHFRRYRHFTIRFLTGLRIDWGASKALDTRLAEEIDSTIESAKRRWSVGS